MSKIPKKWVSVTLADVGHITTGNTPSTKQQDNFNGEIPFVKPGDLDKNFPITQTDQTLSIKGAGQARLLRPGAILVSCIGNLGKIGIAGVTLATNQQINGIEFDETHIDDKYAYYYCKTLKPWMENEASATTVTILNKSKFSKAPFLLSPYREQKRIAEKLDSLLAKVDACKEHLDRVPDILKRFRQSVLAEAVSGRLTADWRVENDIYKKAKYVSLSETESVTSYGTSAKSQKEGDIPVLRMGNIQDGKLDWADLVYTSNEKEIEKYKLYPGDVLFNRTNSPELVGKTAVYRGEIPAIYAGYLIRVKCGELLLSDYLNYCLNSPDGREWCWKVKSDGVSQSNINAKKLGQFQFLLPSIPEQQEIIARVESLFDYIDILDGNYKAGYRQVEMLTPSLLAKAFRGELVPQDPTDEPAVELLERTKKERENRPKSKKPQRRQDMSRNIIGIVEYQPGIVDALTDSKRELSAQELFKATGYPLDANTDQVEKFFVDLRELIDKKLVIKKRRGFEDWFSLS